MARVGVRFNKIAIGLDEISSNDFVHYIPRHLEKVRKTKKIEQYGIELLESNFDPEDLKWFAADIDMGIYAFIQGWK